MPLFRDGVGSMSRAVVERIVQRLRLPRDFTPSAFQVILKLLKLKLPCPQGDFYKIFYLMDLVPISWFKRNVGHEY